MYRLFVKSWVRSYFVSENRVVDGEVRRFDVCQVKNPENGNLPCGRAYKSDPNKKYGTSGLRYHLKQKHSTDPQISYELRLRNINHGGQKVFHYNNLIYD